MYRGDAVGVANAEYAIQENSNGTIKRKLTIFFITEHLSCFTINTNYSAKLLHGKRISLQMTNNH